ncbi:MAG: hypothetical protein WCB49_03520 [Gammaproteobacteria bacterium]
MAGRDRSTLLTGAAVVVTPAALPRDNSARKGITVTGTGAFFLCRGTVHTDVGGFGAVVAAMPREETDRAGVAIEAGIGALL